MLQLMRKHHKVAMIVVATIVCITMIWWGQFDQTQGRGGYRLQIAGDSYNATDIENAHAASIMAFQSSNSIFQQGGPEDAPAKLFKLLNSVQGTTRASRPSEESQQNNTLINMATIRHCAADLGVAVTDEEIAAAIQKLPKFQTDGKFDRSKLDPLLDGKAGDKSRQRHFYAMMRHALLLDKIQKVIAFPMKATELSSSLTYQRQHTESTIHSILVSRKDHEQIKATDEDAQKFYEANEKKAKDDVEALDEVLKSTPTRDLHYVKLEHVKRDEAPKMEDISKLPADQQTAKTKEFEEKTKAFEAKKEEWDAADRKMDVTAQELSNLMADESKTLEEAAAAVKERGNDPKTKDKFVPVEIKVATAVSATNIPEDLKGEEMLVTTALELGGDINHPSKGRGVQALANKKGYVVFDGPATNKARLLTLEEAKAKLIEKLTKEKIDAAHQDKANEILSKLKEGTAGGKKFDEAVAAAALKAEKYTFSMIKRPDNPPAYFGMISQAITSLNPGEFASSPVKADLDLAVVYLEKRELPDDPKMPDDKKRLRTQLGYADTPSHPMMGGSGGNPLFTNWFKQRRAEIDPTYGEEQQVK